MPDPAPNAAAMRLQLRLALKKRRQDAALTQRDVSTNFEWSPSKIIRIESGEVSVGLIDLRAMLQFYRVTEDDVIKQMEEWARGSKQLPYSEYRDILSPSGIKYFGYEGAALYLRQFEPLVVPGLLQTEAYTRAMLGTRFTDPRRADRIVETRRERQEILGRDAPKLEFILDEAVLRREVGGAAVMRAQLRRMREIVDAGNATVAVIPFEAGAHIGHRGSFVLLEFDVQGEADVVYLENPRGGPQFHEEVEVTSSYSEEWTSLESSAAPADRTGYYLDRALESLSSRNE